MRMNFQIRDYEVNLVILDLGSSLNGFTTQTWKKMGSAMLRWSHVQLWLANKDTVTTIMRVSHLDVEVESMKTYIDFDVNEFADGGGSYVALLAIGWANGSMEGMNFKKHIMTFANQDIKCIAPMDPNQGWRYIDPAKDEVVRGWDHAYHI